MCNDIGLDLIRNGRLFHLPSELWHYAIVLAEEYGWQSGHHGGVGRGMILPWSCQDTTFSPTQRPESYSYCSAERGPG